MGMQNQEFVVAICYDYKGELDDLIQSSEGMIVKVPALINGYTNFFYGHHGSKTTSGISEFHNNLREQFIERLEELGYDWYQMGWSESGDGEVSFSSFVDPKHVVWQSPPEEDYLSSNPLKQM